MPAAPPPSPIVAPAAVKSAPAPRSPEPVVGLDGSINFDRLFQEAQLPVPDLTAEQAVQILSRIPSELPLRIRRLAVKASLDILHLSGKEAGESVVFDAANKIVQITRLQETVDDEVEVQRAEIAAEIAELEAEIAQRQEVLAAAQRRADTALANCRQRAAELNKVLIFFDDDGSGGSGSRHQSNSGITFSAGESDADEHPDEAPPYLREESVMRMLGLGSSNHQTATVS
jgi:hypothetical protein